MTKGTLTRSNLSDLLNPESFLWATGIEDTFVFDPHKVTGRILDEYELTEHYERWQCDLELASELGVPFIRYGIPWYRLNPAPGAWRWDFADATLGKLLDLGIEPIVDLVHYGTPEWMQGSFLHPQYPEHVAEYAARVAERYAGRIHWYTPLNEPRVTAWYCGQLGWWPPYQRGDRGFARVLLSVCEGIVRTHRALQAVDAEIVNCHVDATDYYTSTEDRDRPLAEWKQQLVFLPLDLVTGMVDRDHPCYEWLLKHGASVEQLGWFEGNAVVPDVIGLNMYPMFTNKVVTRNAAGRRTRMIRGKPSLVTDLGKLYHARYGRPLIISETASDGTVAQRSAWLQGSLEHVRALREDGVPMVGYTWWPMFSLV
ncbi:MAG TPA: family 1 glycosylhydrolase, partial [Fimbriimonas sp.]